MHKHTHAYIASVRNAFCIMLFTNVYNEYIASRDLTYTNKQTNKHEHTYCTYAQRTPVVIWHDLWHLNICILHALKFIEMLIKMAMF